MNAAKLYDHMHVGKDQRAARPWQIEQTGGAKRGFGAPDGQ